MNDLTYGFFRDFDATDTVLFTGDEVSLAQFAALLRDYERLPKNGLLLGPPLFCARRNTEVTLYPVEQNIGLKIVPHTNMHRFAWRVSRVNAVKFADLLDVMVGSSRPAGHQYLDSDIFDSSGKPELHDEVQVVVSRGEYPISFFEEPD